MISRVTHRNLSWAVAVLLVMSLWLTIYPVRVEAIGVFVQSQTATANNVTSRTVALPAVALAGNLIVVVCAAGSTSTLTMGTAGYSVAAPSAGTTVSQAIFYKIAVGGEQTVQCNSSVSARMGAHIYEYDGVVQASPYDGAATASAATGTAVSTGTYATTTANSLVFGAYVAGGGTGFTVTTSGATERQDFRATTHYGSADRFVTASGSYSIDATNTASGAWRGQLAVFKLMPTQLGHDIVNGSGVSVASPSVVLPVKSFGFTCQTATGTLGVASEKLRVTNTTSSPAWQLSIAPTAGPTASWSNGSTNYDVNDPTTAGCSDGGDADAFKGQLSINPSVSTITPVLTGCTTTNLTKGASSAYNQGTVDSIVLLTANTSAQINCEWDLTGVALSQTIPAEQASGSYTMGLTVTLIAI